MLVAFAVAQLSVQNVGLTVDTNGMNRFELIIWRESNRIASKFASGNALFHTQWRIQQCSTGTRSAVPTTELYTSRVHGTDERTTLITFDVSVRPYRRRCHEHLHQLCIYTSSINRRTAASSSLWDSLLQPHPMPVHHGQQQQPIHTQRHNHTALCQQLSASPLASQYFYSNIGLVHAPNSQRIPHLTLTWLQAYTL